MDCSRDRVHDLFDNDIQNGPFGVTSICTSNTNLNEDVDFGNSLTVTGQKYLDGKFEKDSLIKNYESQIPVRLIRSYNLLNEFAPKTGYRYDGLYIVTNFWIGLNLDSSKHYKFALSRLNDQEPPPWNTKQSSPNTSKVSSALHLATMPLHNCSENLGSASIVQKVNHEKSNGLFQLSNSENKQVDEKEKCNSESVIVTRHVFKKVNTECTNAAPSVSNISENKSFAHIGNQGSKAHNTNISIRTGLYDSSHSTQHDVKKSTSSPFCRATKSLNLLKNNQYTENLNVSSKDKCKNLDGKAQIIATNEFLKRIDYISPNTVKADTYKLKPSRDTNVEVTSSTNDTNLSPVYKYECTVKDAYKSNLNLTDVSSSMLNSTNSVCKNEASVHQIVSKEPQELKSLDSLDALTPDTILSLINKKGHPLSKLLMGNMIGLTSEQSIALKSHELITIQSKTDDKLVMQKNITEETNETKSLGTISDDLIGAQYYKFRRRKRLSRRTMNKSETKKYDRMHNDELQKDSVQSLNALGQKLRVLDGCSGSQKAVSRDVFHLGKCNKDVKNKVTKRNSLQRKKINRLRQSSKAIKKDIRSKNEVRTRLRSIKTIKSSFKKHINRKQRREIANLLIDAKIGPKVRGPRNRRLRCISNPYTKQTCCTLNKCQIDAKISEQSIFGNKNKVTKMNNYKRIKEKQGREKQSKTLSLNENKIRKNLIVSKKVEKGNATETRLGNNVDVGKINEDRKLKLLNANVKSIQNDDTTTTENRRRTSIPTISAKVKCSYVGEKLPKDCKSKDLEPRKADAITQCSLIKEPLVRNFKSNDFVQDSSRSRQYTFIKIKYGECKNTKSDVYEAARSNGESETCRPGGKYKEYCTKSVYNMPYPKTLNKSFNSNVSSTREQNKSSTERMSAFVPVNILDSNSKIARLRSIGFKPIASFDNSNEDVSSQNKGSCSTTFSNELLTQKVAEKYNKYTNEEDDVVVYMDDELQYQDIEDEDNNFSITRHRLSGLEVHTPSNEQMNKVTFERALYSDPLLEQDLESPWHGWKKVVTNQDTYWIGW